MVRSGINVISTVWNLCDDSMVWSILPPFLNTVAFQVCRHVQITTSFNFAKHWTLLGWSQMLPTATTYYIHVLQIDYETQAKKSKVQKFVKLLYGWRLTSLSSLLDVRIICLFHTLLYLPLREMSKCFVHPPDKFHISCLSKRNYL